MSWLSVDLQFFAGEKTEKATPRKRQEVRKKGQVAKSADVTAAFLMLIVFLVLSFSSGMWGDAIVRLFRQSFQHYFFMDVTIDSVQLIFVDLLQQLALLVDLFF